MTESPVRLALVAEPGKTYDNRGSAGDPEAAARIAWSLLQDEPAECFGAILLDVRQRVLAVTIAYRGTLSRAAVEPRGILVPALLANASAVVVFHNHPSGDPTPSAEDRAFTRRLADACTAVGLKLHDHIVMGGPDRWASFSRGGGMVNGNASTGGRNDDCNQPR